MADHPFENPAGEQQRQGVSQNVGKASMQQRRGENAPPLPRMKHERAVQPAERHERAHARRKIAVRLDGENQFHPVNQAEHDNEPKGHNRQPRARDGFARGAGQILHRAV